MRHKNIKYILIIVILIMGLITGCFLFYNSRFRIVESSPIGNIFPSGSNELVYTFNRELDTTITNDDFKVTINPNASVQTKIKNRSLHIIFSDSVPDEFIVNISNIKAKDGSLIKNVTKKYSVDYVPENKLSKYDYNKSMNVVDIDEKKYPIINDLPIYGDYYIIDYQIPDASLSSATTPPLILKIKTLGVNRLQPPTTTYLDTVHKLALDDIQKRGYKLEQFTIIFDDSPM